MPPRARAHAAQAEMETLHRAIRELRDEAEREQAGRERAGRRDGGAELEGAAAAADPDGDGDAEQHGMLSRPRARLDLRAE